MEKENGCRAGRKTCDGIRRTSIIKYGWEIYWFVALLIC